MKTYKPGDKLPNGAVVLASTFSFHKHVVLAQWGTGHHPYVTWRVDEGGHTFLGHYFSNINEAMTDLGSR